MPVLVISATIAVVYEEITSYLAILGGFIAVIVSFMYPCLLYVKTNDYPRYHHKNILTILFSVIIVIVGWIAGIVTIKNSINDKGQ